MEAKLRTLIHSRLYDDLLTSLEGAHDVADAVEGLTLYVAENPYKFSNVGHGYYIGKSVASSRVPALRILYLIQNEDEVLLCAISEDS